MLIGVKYCSKHHVLLMEKKITVTFYCVVYTNLRIPYQFVNFMRSLMACNNSLCVRRCSGHLLICVNSLRY